MRVAFPCKSFSRFLMLVAFFLARSATAFSPSIIITRRVALLQSSVAAATTMSFSSSSSSSQYWNREESVKQTLDSPIVKHAKIISLSAPDDDANKAVNQQPLPQGASLLAIGTTLDDFDVQELKKQEPNVIFVAHAMARQPLADLLTALPTIEWVHARSAGIDFITSPVLSSTTTSITVTNAKGTFSSTLAEYTLMACSYFAKNIPRLEQQKKKKEWCKYSVLELRGATLGIIGYGDIGRATAKLANAYGMKVQALRRHPKDDPLLVDTMYSHTRDNLLELVATSDYILCSLPLTNETRGMLDKEVFDHVKQDAVFINVGRGPIVDEAALIQALSKGTRLKGAALDVFETEPLPTSSELWNLPNVLMSPHNMDQTETFMHEATDFFLQENVPRFVRGEPLLNPVDSAAGY